MKVKIGDTIYSSSEVPIMVMLSPEDKEYITETKGSNYTCFPFGTPPSEINRWIKEV